MAKVVKVTYLERNDDDKAAEIDKFTDVLALNHNFIFGDALYQINKITADEAASSRKSAERGRLPAVAQLHNQQNYRAGGG